MIYRLFFFLSILFASVCVQADDAEIIDLHKSLVSIQSTTKTGDSQTDERNVQTFIEKWLRETAEKNNFRINIERQQVTEGRDNLYVYAGAATERSTSVMMTSHVDTVPPHFGYRVEGDKIYGRGTNDAKGCVAAMMIAFRDLIVSKQVKEEGGELSLLFVVGEEIGGEGMTEVPKLGLTWDTVIFGEPTDSKLASGQIGGMVFNITALGKTVHSGFPELGINAIDGLRAIMDALHLALDGLDSNPNYGQNSLTIAQIRGGVADNAVPPSAWVSGSYRLTVSPSKVVEKLGRLINEKACPSDPDNPCKSVEVKYPLQEDPLDIDHDVPGFETFGARFGSDISVLKGKHHKYLFGPGSILTAHQPDEFVTKQELVRAVDGYKKIVLFRLQAGKNVSAAVDHRIQG
ncbi:Peptidase M20 domain-containing protein [Colletotrichum tanaceti]|uniref:Peptidase M20 domain-containing protein n=1 Tax=Colletotrichum tanaceti TaxID=1306861 RepID=A0A4U6XHN7_9PEZI|nr:Peptidase M20 domain-containing protein [Colletotrichum tanaceti]TKW53577.1 Peptidase M20 domain-containing protein [Colletotrichum tanaceti]